MRLLSRRRLALPCVWLTLALGSGASGQIATAHEDVVIKNATVMTVTHGIIKNGSIYIKNGKIAAVGETVAAPATATVIDAGGKYLTPGIVDSHSHIALDDDVNEATSPVTPHMMMKDAFDYQDKAIYRALAGGVTTSLLLHGSANMIGGQAVVIKHKYGASRDEMLFPNAPRSIKFASGENPKRVYGGREQLPSTRMGNFAVQREALVQAQDYMREWDNYNEKIKRGEKKKTKRRRQRRHPTQARPEARSARRHSARQSLWCRFTAIAPTKCSPRSRWPRNSAIRFAPSTMPSKPTRSPINWPPTISPLPPSPTGGAISKRPGTRSRGTPTMSMRKGVRVAIKSDSEDYTRRLNQEAAKIMRYGGATEEEALKMITLNAAWIVGVDDRVGSIDVGKDADLVIWDGYPLSSYGVPEKVLIDGEVYFDRALPGLGMTHYKEGE